MAEGGACGVDTLEGHGHRCTVLNGDKCYEKFDAYLCFARPFSWLLCFASFSAATEDDAVRRSLVPEMPVGIV